MQNPLHQLQKLDISALSSFDEFSNVMKLLSQVDNPEFVKQIEQKLKDNLAFREFQKERERENSPRLAEARSGWLAELVAQKRQATQRSERVQAGQNNLNFTNVQMLSAVYSQILNEQGVEGLIRSFETHLKQLDFSDPEKAVVDFGKHTNAFLATVANSDVEIPPEKQQEILNAGEKVVKELENNNAGRETIVTAQIHTENLKFVLNNRESAREIFDFNKLDENGFPTIKETTNIDSYVAFMRDFGTIYKKGTPEQQAEIQRLQENNGFSVVEAEKEWQKRKAIFDDWKMNRGLQAFSSILKRFYETAQTYEDENLKGVFSQKDFNEMFNFTVESIFAMNNPTQAIAMLKQQVRRYGEEVNVLGFQFQDFGLYFANAQRVMKSENISFADFVQSDEGQKFKVALQVLNSSLVKNVVNLDRQEALTLMEELGIKRDWANSALDAYQELKQHHPALLNSLQNEMHALTEHELYILDNKGLGVSLLMKTKNEYFELVSKNPDWRGTAPIHNEKQELDVAENNAESAKLGFDEDLSYKINKDEIALFTTETTNTFQNNQVVHPESILKKYKSSI